MKRKTIFDYGRWHHNHKFVGWATWKVHSSCTCAKCPLTVAHFYGPKAKSHAKEFAHKLNQEIIG